MDKAQEKIEQIQDKWGCNPVDEPIIAREILTALEELGYRKLPEGEPPLLSSEDINLCGIKHVILRKDAEAIAQAQRDSDIRWYGGE